MCVEQGVSCARRRCALSRACRVLRRRVCVEQGALKLFPYPSPSPDAAAACKAYDSGLAAVDLAAYAHDDTALVVVSRADRAIQVPKP